MHKLIPLFALLTLAVFLALPTHSADAGYPGMGWGYGTWPYNSYSFQPTPYTLGQVPVPPYFALHPPVYYSAPVPRSYGYSPYAYPGTKETPVIMDAEPAVIENPYVAPQEEQIEEVAPAAEETSLDTKHHTATATQPVVIENPFVKVSVANKK